MSIIIVSYNLLSFHLPKILIRYPESGKQHPATSGICWYVFISIFMANSVVLKSRNSLLLGMLGLRRISGSILKYPATSGIRQAKSGKILEFWKLQTAVCVHKYDEMNSQSFPVFLLDDTSYIVIFVQMCESGCKLLMLKYVHYYCKL